MFEIAAAKAATKPATMFKTKPKQKLKLASYGKAFNGPNNETMRPNRSDYRHALLFSVPRVTCIIQFILIPERKYTRKNGDRCVHI